MGDGPLTTCRAIDVPLDAAGAIVQQLALHNPTTTAPQIVMLPDGEAVVVTPEAARLFMRRVSQPGHVLHRLLVGNCGADNYDPQIQRLTSGDYLGKYLFYRLLESAGPIPEFDPKLLPIEALKQYFHSHDLSPREVDQLIDIAVMAHALNPKAFTIDQADLFAKVLHSAVERNHVAEVHDAIYRFVSKWKTIPYTFNDREFTRPLDIIDLVCHTPLSSRCSTTKPCSINI